jgi:DNA-binding transcriptional ArsR family regulator
MIEDEMKPLFHPSVGDVSVETILHALSDPVRVSILAELAYSQCAATCSALQGVINKPVPKSTLSQHFKILREAGLIHSERKGIEVLNTSRCEEFDARFPGLIESIVRSYAAQSQEKKISDKKKKRRSE